MIKLTLIFALFTAPAFAQTSEESSTKLNVEKVTEKANKPEGQDVDTIITNNKLRTDIGSKSRYSISTSLGYSGGSLNQPFGETRPNITAAVGTTDFPSLGGSISGKYSFTTQHSLFGGVGVRWVAPLSGEHAPKGYTGDRMDVDNPYVVYQYVYNMGGLQSSVQARQTWITTSDVVQKGFLTSWGLGQNSVYEIGSSGVSVGFNTYVGLAMFTKHTPELKAEQGDYSWAFMPAIEYRLTDRTNLRLDTNLFVFEHMRNYRDPWTFRRLDVSQNFSVGYSVTRDIYISPGISFVITNLRPERTTWSLNAGANIF